ncbi:MAG: class I SAM-dependent methyltransferase [Oligoflexia bacterium]|nr:class I SAM-dependent methyltransferase [Oligoflexia bacterium]
MDLSNLYSGQYVDSTYSGQEGLKKTFDRIIALAADKSDNYGRVKSINDFAFNFFENKKNHTILDIGSGLGVFPYAMQKLNWECTALDPDPRACEHLKNTVGVKSICADFLKAEDIGQYDCISLNKVLEHVDNPIKMLSKVKKYLKPKGLIYIEVPDGEQSELDGKDREEFFIDHLHIFSLTSLCLLAKKSDLTLLNLERLKEPSSKYTLRAFLTHHGSGKHT